MMVTTTTRSSPTSNIGLWKYLLLSVFILQQNLLVSCGRYQSFVGSRQRIIEWGTRTSSLSPSSLPSISQLQILEKTLQIRGGEDDVEEESEEEKETNEEEDDEEEEDDDEEVDDKPITATSMEPVTIRVKTNLGNPLLDVTLDIMAVRTRNVASLKSSLSRQIPGKPPQSMIQLWFNGELLKDHMLVYELMDEEDEDEDDEDEKEESEVSVTLVADMVPTVDPQFASMLEDKMKEQSTSDLLDAYVLNEAALYHSAQWIGKKEEQDDEDTEESSFSSRLSVQLREHAQRIRDQMESDLFGQDETIQALLEETAEDREAALMAARQPQIKGERIRPGAASVSTGGHPSGFRQMLQRNMNINWSNTWRNFFLFLFFGWFGGRTSLSKSILLMGAPLSFILQARPIKFWLRELQFCVFYNPPSIFLSLLPAPQQAILALDSKKALQLVYGDDVLIDDDEAALEDDMDEDEDDDYEEEEDEDDDDDDDDDDEDDDDDDD